jgi:hypothetical protein
VAVDVLEDDDRVIDHASDGDREAAQGHDVQADPRDLHDHEGGQQRQRDADGRDQRRSQAPQEQEDRQDGEQGAGGALAEQPVARFDDERGQVGHDRDRHDVGVLDAQLVELGGHRLGDLDGVRGRGLGHRQRQRRPAALLGRGGARVARGRDAGDLDHAEVADGDGLRHDRCGRRGRARVSGGAGIRGCARRGLRRRRTRAGRDGGGLDAHDQVADLVEAAIRTDRRDRGLRPLALDLAGRDREVVRGQDAHDL